MTLILFTGEKSSDMKNAQPIRILFVCHGNICRSPMAEFLFRELARQKGVEDRFSVASAATSDEELGNAVYPPARTELARHGISCGGKRAVQLQKSGYEKYDLILCMEDRNVHNALRILGSDPEGKVRKLLERNVSDPWYTGDFSTAYRDIREGCLRLLEELG